MNEKEIPKFDGTTPIEKSSILTEEERRALDEKAQEFDKKMKALFEKIGVK